MKVDQKRRKEKDHFGKQLNLEILHNGQVQDDRKAISFQDDNYIHHVLHDIFFLLG